MITAIIIDDEQHCADRLYSILITKHKNSINIIGVFSTVEDGISAIETLNPELVFLDVQINEKTGFDLLKHFTKINFKVIFITAYDMFAVQAIKFSAIDYLLKPVGADELATALNKAIESISIKDMRNMIEVLSKNLSTPTRSKTITIPTRNELIFLSTDDIIRCHSNINYTTIFKKDKQKIVVAKTLKEFEELLTDHNFFRIHNSELINLSYIKSYNKGKGGSIILTDGAELEVSVRRKEEFLKKMATL
ncbi:MAG: LytTR family DNA-binding domain-containing protein [Ferruginibacter sp.]